MDDKHKYNIFYLKNYNHTPKNKCCNILPQNSYNSNNEFDYYINLLITKNVKSSNYSETIITLHNK